MNHRPSLLQIVNKIIYIIGGTELYIISLENPRTDLMYNLGKSLLVDLCPSVNNEKITGVILYSWNNSLGYQKRFFSIDGSDNGGWLNGLKSMFMKK